MPEIQKITTYSAVRVDFPPSFDAERAAHLRGSVVRFSSVHDGRVLLDIRDGSLFVLTDLDGAFVSSLLHIVEVAGAVPRVRLISSSFFDSLFSDVAGEGVACG